MDNTTKDIESSTNDNNHAKSLQLVKEQATEALIPVIDNLTSIGAERKFDICLNAMRYTDNEGLAGVALSAALAIEEAGTKAEALVELINEIDYLQANGK